MHWLGWIVVLLAVIEGGWFAYDGGHALIRGDYVTPKSGQYERQTRAVVKIGVHNRHQAALNLDEVHSSDPRYCLDCGHRLLHTQVIMGVDRLVDVRHTRLVVSPHRYTAQYCSDYFAYAAGSAHKHLIIHAFVYAKPQAAGDSVIFDQ